jgi:hypothetical protein
MKKRNENTVEDRLFVAERQYDRMMENVNQGIINRDEINLAMYTINIAHHLCLEQNKAHLIK